MGVEKFGPQGYVSCYSINSTYIYW